MADIKYRIFSDGGNPIIESGQAGNDGWTGTIFGVDLAQTPANSVPSSITATFGGLTITFTPDATNGYKVYPSITDTNHYTTFRSQNIATQYPNSGYSLDIWSESLYNTIANPGNPSSPGSWQLITENDPYNLNNSKYSLLYDYGSPTAARWCRGGKIAFLRPDEDGYADI
jgi:hypothetical protein